MITVKQKQQEKYYTYIIYICMSDHKYPLVFLMIGLISSKKLPILKLDMNFSKFDFNPFMVTLFGKIEVFL